MNRAMNRAQIAALAAEIMQAVIENGRVDGENPDSLRTEVEFEARERGLIEAAEIADMAVRISGWDRPATTKRINIEVPLDQLAEVDKRAGAQGRSAWIREAIRRRLAYERK